MNILQNMEGLGFREPLCTFFLAIAGIFLKKLYHISQYFIQYLNNSVGIAFALKLEGRGFDSPTLLFLVEDS